jgi:hypothetical protein
MLSIFLEQGVKIEVLQDFTLSSFIYANMYLVAKGVVILARVQGGFCSNALSIISEVSFSKTCLYACFDEYETEYVHRPHSLSFFV